MSTTTKEGKTHTVSAKVTITVKKKLESLAKKRDRKVSHIVNQILTSYFGN